MPPRPVPLALGLLIAPFMAMSLVAARPANADALDDDLNFAKALLLAGKLDDAATKLDALQARAKEAVNADPANAHAQYILGAAAMYAGDDTQAQTALNIAARLEPENLTYLLMRAQFFSFRDLHKEAIVQLQEILEKDAKNLQALTMMGDALSKSGQPADAQKQYQKAADLAPKDAKYMGMVGQSLTAQHKDDDALAAFQKALAIDPAYAIAWSNIGQIHQARGANDKALDAFTKVLAITPDDFGALSKEVQLYQAMEKPKERDGIRDKLLALYKADKIDADLFCREQFVRGKTTVIVGEYFELKGATALRYAFNLVAADGRSVERRISLGSYDAITAAARATGDIKPDARLFHLDAYTKTGHETLATFKTEPTYEETRALVMKYLNQAVPLLPDAPVSPPPAGGVGR